MPEPTNEQKLMDLEFPAEVWLASERLELGHLLRLQPGEVLRLSVDPDGPAELVVNGTPVCSGELVVVDGHFGFRVISTEDGGLAGSYSKMNDKKADPATEE